MLQVGTILVAKKECRMKNGSGNALIVGKEYPIKSIKGSDIIIKSEIDANHFFETNENEASYYGRFFDIKE